jgi:hypothetical protein
MGISAIFLLPMLILMLIGCSRVEDRETTFALNFNASVNVNVREECEITLGVSNDGECPFPGDATFNAMMELMQVNRISRGEVESSRARLDVHELEMLEPGERVSLASWRTRLLPGEYRVIWGAPGYGYLGVDFSLLESNGHLYLEEVSSGTLPDGDPPVWAEPSAPILGLTGLSRQG